MPEKLSGKDAVAAGDHCLAISLDSAASYIRTSSGEEIPFARAVLSIRNVCNADVLNVVPHVSVEQEGGTVQDVSRVCSQDAAASIPAGGSVSWDVYDQLLPAHPGTASKIHMFGYRAALNWRFELSAHAEYCNAGSSLPLQTPVSRWTFRWSVTNVNTGEVGLVVDSLP